MDIFTLITRAKSGYFDTKSTMECLEKDAASTIATDNNGNTLLHFAALHDNNVIVSMLLEHGANPHQQNYNKVNGIGETAFNIAAPSSPKAGRLMTLHWYKHASEGKGMGLNEVSGQHSSSLIQYAAKWCTAEEIEQMTTPVHEIDKEAINIFVSNASGWTPLHASAAMPDRDEVVAVLIRRYRVKPEWLVMKTTEAYSATYNYPQHNIEVVYPKGITARDTAQCRLDQDHMLSDTQRASIERSLHCITAEV